MWWVSHLDQASRPLCQISWGGTEICQCRTGRCALRGNMSLEWIKTWGSFDTAIWSILVLENQGTPMFDRTWINDDQWWSMYVQQKIVREKCRTQTAWSIFPAKSRSWKMLKAGGVSDHHKLTVVLLANPPLFVLSHNCQHENWWPMMNFNEHYVSPFCLHLQLPRSHDKRHVLGGHDMVYW